ncbi:hypothetical protein J2855_001751 [Agrobacterium tumefaciens]|uniref:hypothetical protein n=1 Tax=Agrobacterium tumefaciens TaxID=358 RepID=UPI000DD3F639|nr:hypothetical protein [Agrobacterium tumefaciens]MBP2508116.1 hypothetical protein [Agrobacterium tumefaciens]MBP2517268.1 hypothetical protein [Agrobacterium tumefaciens]MBP2575902.1 hypothetical protein [Agrobacterium tumefaciens]MBP2594258.1 hypothetical protein [Agrobacterium tumefaciens]UXS24205.1 hypothetical protein FY153_06950 [Agrobacterium tumefaciens]
MADPEQQAIPNPAGDAFNVSVLVPEQIAIRMVDASALSDYEYHIFVASLFASGTVGFLVPCVQEFKSQGQLAIPFLFITALLGAVFLASLIIALVKRRALRKSGREIKLTTKSASF